MFNVEEFFKANKRLEPKDIEGFGQVWISELDCQQFDKISMVPNKLHQSLRLIIATACDQEGKPIFKDEDLPKLNALPIGRILPLLNACNEVNNLSMEEDDLLGKSGGIE
mgnify:CR=1 FL=1|jgi:hypothetical protein|tara:strand:- start:3110 stop:3439 length:330 start_codon:yes stop_codon:yes gene_type:complete